MTLVSQPLSSSHPFLSLLCHTPPKSFTYILIVFAVSANAGTESLLAVSQTYSSDIFPHLIVALGSVQEE